MRKPESKSHCRVIKNETAKEQKRENRFENSAFYRLTSIDRSEYCAVAGLASPVQVNELKKKRKKNPVWRREIHGEEEEREEIISVQKTVRAKTDMHTLHQN